MYRRHFGLSKLPFKNTPDHHFFYEQASRSDILNGLLYVIQRGDPIVKVTGEVGCGKTTLLRLLAKQLDARFEVVYINSPNLSPKDLLFHIADELSLPYSADLPKYALLKNLRERLLQLHGEGKQVVMLVDEAQAMTQDTLEEVRLLSNIETDEDKLIQIVLFGQPELDRALQQHSLRQLRDRITYHMHVPPLTAEELKSYLNYRMRQASYKGLDFFNSSFAKRIHKLTGGLPRSINTIADQLLMAAYGHGDDTLKRKHFKNISIENISVASRRRFGWGLVGLVAVVLAVSIFWWRIDTSIQTLFISDDVHSIASVTPPDDSVSIPKEEHSVSRSAAVDEESSPKASPIKAISIETEQAGIERNRLPATLPFEAKILDPILNEHNDTVQWLKAGSAGRYMIQLMTCSVSDYSKALSDLKNNKIVFENIRIVLDLNKNTEKYRVKFLYSHSDSYSHLVKEMAELPAGMKVSQPFITPVRHILNDLDRTKQTLNDWDIS